MLFKKKELKEKKKRLSRTFRTWNGFRAGVGNYIQALGGALLSHQLPQNMPASTLLSDYVNLVLQNPCFVKTNVG